MVGGAIWGYCAIGSVESAMTPTSVITMLITPAKIGRSIKKWGKFIALAPEDVRLSLWLFGWRGAGRLCRGLFRNWLNRHPRLDQLQPCRNHLLTVLQSTLHDPFAFENRSGLDSATLQSVVRFHHEDVLHALL